MKKPPVITYAISCLFGMSLSASAAVEEGTLDITATVIAQCTVTTTPVAFGEISPTQAATATGSITIHCDDDNTLDSVTLDGGNNESGGTRQMTDNATHHVPYTLSVDGSSVAPDGDVAGSFTFPGSAPFEASVNVQGTIAAVPAPGREVGEYSDAVTITVTYSAPAAP